MSMMTAQKRVDAVEMVQRPQHARVSCCQHSDDKRLSEEVTSRGLSHLAQVLGLKACVVLCTRPAAHRSRVSQVMASVDSFKISGKTEKHELVNGDYQLVSLSITSCDAAGVLLQATPSDRDKEIFTAGVSKLAIALGAVPGETLRFLRAAYGQPTIPRSPWVDVRETGRPKMPGIMVGMD